MRRHALPIERRQRGAAALVVTMAIFLAALLATLYVNRQLIVEQRSSANQYRSSQAFEAAEGGIEWAVAMLNDRRRIGTDCRPSTAANASTFAARLVGPADARGRFAPLTALQGSVRTALRPACVLVAEGWSCDCPTGSASTLAAPSGTAPAPAFVLRFTAADRAHVFRLDSTGCANLAGACAPGAAAGEHADASSALQIDIGALPALRSAPLAAITVRGDFDSGAAPLSIVNRDANTGAAIRAGGRVTALAARLEGPKGSASVGAVVSEDAALSGLSADNFFAAHFGLDKAAWKAQPLVTHVVCEPDCGAALASAVAAANTGAGDGAIVHIDGDLRLAGPAVFGTALRPVLLVVDGAVQLEGAVQFNGLLYARSLRWRAAGVDASLRGAAVSESDYSGDGAPTLTYDAPILAALRLRPSAYARVSGSWHELVP